jgi:hypothetical protein
LLRFITSQFIEIFANWNTFEGATDNLYRMSILELMFFERRSQLVFYSKPWLNYAVTVFFDTIKKKFYPNFIILKFKNYEKEASFFKKSNILINLSNIPSFFRLHFSLT